MSPGDRRRFRQVGLFPVRHLGVRSSIGIGFRVHRGQMGGNGERWQRVTGYDGRGERAKELEQLSQMFK